MHPTNVKFWLELAIVCNYFGMIDEAIKFATHVGRLDPNNLHADRVLGAIMIRIGQPQRALNYFNRVLVLVQSGNNTGPTTYSVLNNIGIAYKKMNDIENAHITFDLAIEHDPFEFDAYLNLSVLFMHIGQFKMALRVIRDAICIDPTNPVVWSVLSNMYTCFGRPRDAAAMSHIVDQLQNGPDEFKAMIENSRRRKPSFLRSHHPYVKLSERIYMVDRELTYNEFTVQSTTVIESPSRSSGAKVPESIA